MGTVVVAQDNIRDGSNSPLLAAITAGVTEQLARPLPPGLYVVSTPIGNLADMTVRALAVLAGADLIYCEDTRHSRHLTAHYGISTPLDAYHEHNGEHVRPRILAALAAGRRIALISDAGTPLISDPGYKLVREAAAAGHAVTAVPGASAVLTALAVGGLPTDAFVFAGFLPPKQVARRNRLQELAAMPATLVLFEAPGRLVDTLDDIAVVAGHRACVVARELTKLHEEFARGTPSELALKYRTEAPRGEIVILIAPPSATVAADDAAVRRHLSVALGEMSVRDAAQTVAEALSVPRGRVYDLALTLKRERETP
jgi:16S rRNA (cytidine1402-2'-O)-methyltransferase